MKLKLAHKLFFSNLGIVLITILILIGVGYYSGSSQSAKFIGHIDEDHIEQVVENVNKHYIENGSLDAIASQNEQWSKFLQESRIDPGPIASPQISACDSEDSCRELLNKPKAPDDNNTLIEKFTPQLPPFMESFTERVSILDNNGLLLAGNLGNKFGRRFPLQVNGQHIGWLALSKPNMIKEIPYSPFFHSAFLYIYWLATIGTIAVIISSYFLSRHMARPIRDLRNAALQISQRNFNIQIPIRSKDEFGDLAASMNDISKKLAKYENRQQRWIMDISHELRTPLTILIGEIEAVADGISKMGTAQIDSLLEEAQQIKRLVDDLHELSVTDRVGFNLYCVTIDLNNLVHNQLERYKEKLQKNNINFSLNHTKSTVYIDADPSRLTQVLQNLLENCLRHVDTPGQLKINIAKNSSNAIIEVKDSGPGVPKDELDLIFNPLYRINSSPGRMSNGTGLGLAICKNIIEAHKGEISASLTKSGGLKIIIKLPL